MSKGLEKLKTIRHIHDMECGEDESINKDFDIIEKELKALKVIVKTFEIKVSINQFGQCFVESNGSIYAISHSTYDLLKEVLL